MFKIQDFYSSHTQLYRILPAVKCKSGLLHEQCNYMEYKHKENIHKKCAGQYTVDLINNNMSKNVFMA